MRIMLVASTLLLRGLFASGGVAAQDSPGNTIPVQLEAGETYVIDNLDRSTPARVNIIRNPNALVVNNGIPGELMLVGAEAGRWEITAEQRNSEWVTYDVTVTSIAMPFSNPLAPGKLPSTSDHSNTNNFSTGPEPKWLTNQESKTIEVDH